METQTRLSRHSKFIIGEEYYYTLRLVRWLFSCFFLVEELQMWSYSSYSEEKIKKLENKK